jgi:SlyX protein
MTTERLDQIEILLAHQEKQIEELSDMTARQWEAIDLLKRRLETVIGRLNDMEISARESKTDGAKSVAEIAAIEKPPHY